MTVDCRSEAFPRLRRFRVAGLAVTSVRSTTMGLLAVVEGCVGGGFGAARKIFSIFVTCASNTIIFFRDDCVFLIGCERVWVLDVDIDFRCMEDLCI